MFIKYILVWSAIILLIAIYPVFFFASTNQVLSIAVGYAVSFINVIIGYSLNKTALRKNVKSFMVIVFGGMAIRLVVVAIILLILLTYSKLESVSLVSSVFFFYFLFISIEIYFLLKKPKNILDPQSPDTISN